MLSAITQQQYLNVADWCVSQTKALPCPVIGINGAQGSGKSTLAAFLVDALADKGLRCATLSIDDCYLSRADRARLAEEVHPLLQTRGVPGTHDVRAGIQLLQRLSQLKAGEPLRMPVFSKAADDLRPESDWRRVRGPFDLVLFEGWCVGIPPQNAADLLEPINALEQEEDADGRWRRYVNNRLATDYAEWFDRIHALVYLQLPGFDQVIEWRGQQERQLAAQVDGQGDGLMSAPALERFIRHYERLTRQALKILPSQADVCISLDTEHSVTSVRF